MYDYVKYWKDGVYMEITREAIVEEIKHDFGEKKKEIEKQIYDLKRKEQLLLIANYSQDLYEEDRLNAIQYFETIGVTKDEVANMQNSINQITNDLRPLNVKVRDINKLIDNLA